MSIIYLQSNIHIIKLECYVAAKAINNNYELELVEKFV